MRMFAKQIVALQPDVILAFGTPVTAALQRETRTVPIVLAIVSDPVGGRGSCEPIPSGRQHHRLPQFRRVDRGQVAELLTQIAPRVKRAAMIFNPDTAPGHGKYYMPDFEAAARSSNVTPIAAPVHSIAELEAVVTELGRRAWWWLCGHGGFFLIHPSRSNDIAGSTKQCTGRVPLA